MNCPVDNTPLTRRQFQTVTIEECPQCRGLWFEGDELRQAKDAAPAADTANPMLNWLDFDLWAAPDKFNLENSQRHCPQCAAPLAALTYAATGVTVDCCAQKHGVWLDQGEFEAIIAALRQETLQKTVPEYVTASLQEAQEILTGKEGLVSEWKDLGTVLLMLQYRLLAENSRLTTLLFDFQAKNPLR